MNILSRILNIFSESLFLICVPRLPDGDKHASHLRDIFYRMGFDDRGIVALSGTIQNFINRICKLFF